MTTLRFTDPAYPGGRIPLMCGGVMVGAVYPPVGHPPNKWAWRIWAHGQTSAPDGHCKDEAHARAAALAAFQAFLDRAQLMEKPE